MFAPFNDSFAKATLLRSPGDNIQTFLNTSLSKNKNLPSKALKAFWDIVTSEKFSKIVLLLSKSSCS